MHGTVKYKNKKIKKRKKKEKSGEKSFGLHRFVSRILLEKKNCRVKAKLLPKFVNWPILHCKDGRIVTNQHLLCEKIQILSLIEQSQCMNYSNTVVIHAPKEKVRGILEKNILYTYVHNEQILRKIGKEKRSTGKKKNWMG